MRNQLLAATALSTSILFLVPGAYAQSAYDWGGAYVGVTLGGVGTTSEITTTFDDQFSMHGSGYLAGVTAGYNFVLNENFVVGIEGDASLAGLEGSGSELWNYADEKLDSLLSLRARAGLTTGPLLAYATLGVAGGQASYSTDVYDSGKSPSPQDPSSGSGFVAGVIGGAGMEVAVSDNMSVKLEGLMYQMSPLDGSGDTNTSDSSKGAYDSEYKPSGVVIRSGVNFGF